MSQELRVESASERAPHEIRGETVTYTLRNETDDAIELKASGGGRVKLEIPPRQARQLSAASLAAYHYGEAERDGRISVEKDEPLFEVVNKTAKRIAIARVGGGRAGGEDFLILPAFGRRQLREAAVNEYECLRWKRHNLIDVDQVRPESEGVDTSAAIGFLSIWLLVGFWLKDAFPPWFGLGPSPLLSWGLYASVAIVLLVLGWKGVRGLQRVLQSLNFILLVGVGVVMPGLALYFFGGVGELLATEPAPLDPLVPAVSPETQPLWLFGRGVQLLLLSILTLLPGMLYFQFERQQVGALKERFFREIMLLTPTAQSLDDVRILYGDLVDEISGVVGEKQRQYSLLTAGRPILLATVLISLGWLITLSPVGALGAANWVDEFVVPRPSVPGFAFLGAYLFAIGQVFRRYARGDLSPKTYTHIAVRIVMALIVAWVFGEVVPPEEGGAAAYVAAFLVGIFPESGVAMLNDLQKKSFGRAFPSFHEQHPITDLQGVSIYDRARLLEEGVESVENLAHYNVIELMLRSRIPASRLVDLVDQAILYLHVDGEVDAADAGTASDGGAVTAGPSEALQYLRSYGIRTATDLIQAYRPDPDQPPNEQLLNLLGPEDETRPKRLRVILDALRDDEWLDYLVHWRRQSRELAGRVFTLEDIVQAGSLASGGSGVQPPAKDSANGVSSTGP